MINNNNPLLFHQPRNSLNIKSEAGYNSTHAMVQKSSASASHVKNGSACAPVPRGKSRKACHSTPHTRMSRLSCRAMIIIATDSNHWKIIFCRVY